MKITTLGFTPFEQQLLGSQLKIITGHSNSLWEYSGEAQLTQADVVLVRPAAGSAASLLRQLEGFGGLLAFAGETPAQHAGALQLEWPLRVFSLLALLERAESALQSTAPAQPLCEQLASLRRDAWIDIDGWTLHFGSGASLLTGHGGDFEQALSHLLQAGSDAIPRINQGLPSDDSPCWKASLERLLWSLALHQPLDPGPQWLQSSRLYRLESFPHFEEWEVSPQWLRLAALFTRHSASIDSAAERCALEPHQVRSFLYACKLCGLGLREEHPVAMAQASVEDSSMKGLLGQLRRRLGLGVD